jgi:hypothetical protein
MKYVMNVNDVQLTDLLSFPARWVITAYGHVPTGGWTNPQLEQRVYVAPPVDGVIDFDFVAQPPGGLAPDIVLPISAHTGVIFLPPWAKGVRVNSASNSITKSFSTPSHSVK